MSKSQILSWTSLATSASAAVFYFLFVFGWPDAVPDYSAKFVKIFFNVFWIAIAVEIFVDINASRNKVQKDERDILIEGKGYKAGYNILVVAVVFTIIQYFISSLFSSESGSNAFASLFGPNDFFHFLFLALFISNVARRITMLYYYRKSS